MSYARINLPQRPIYTQGNTVRVFGVVQPYTTLRQVTHVFLSSCYEVPNLFNIHVANGVVYVTFSEALDAGEIDDHVFMLHDGIIGFARVEGAWANGQAYPAVAWMMLG